ncbi:MAG: DUF4349 domain-containing protein [Oleispira sp.]|nr:DUF4349 domain-containing protein [Oleispira sp.]
MKKIIRLSLLLVAVALSMKLTGCAAIHSHDEMSGQSFAMEAAPMVSRSLQMSKMRNDLSEQERKLIKRSWLIVGVKNLAVAQSNAKTIVEQQAGYIQHSNDEQGKSFSLSIRVPQNHYLPTLKQLRSVGKVVSENEDVQDVTTEFIDNQARLDNLYKLRNRIRLLLGQADRIEDILKIERELNRTQSEIDRLEGRMKYLKGQVDYASIEFSAEKQKTYGPLGYFFMGIWWGIEKLFVWDS